MAGLGNYGAAQALDYTVAGTRYLALLMDLLKDGSGTDLPEASFAGYARTAIPPSAWTAVSNGCISNAAPVALPIPPTGQVQIVQCALLDDPTAGNLWWALDAFAFVLDADDPSPAIAPGALVIGLPWMASA